MVKCEHNYRYTQGYFFCTKCGNRQYGQGRYYDYPNEDQEELMASVKPIKNRHVHRSHKTRKIIGTMFVFFVIGIGGFLVINPTILDDSRIQEVTKTIGISDVINALQDMLMSINAESYIDKMQIMLENMMQTMLEYTMPGMLEKTIAQNELVEQNKNLILEEDYEFYIYKYTNDARTTNGLSHLRLNKDISKVARLHSYNMAENNFFKHVNPDGESPTDRGNVLGVSCVKHYEGYYTMGLGENIHKIPKGHSYIKNQFKQNAQFIVDGWMDSPGHRKNILNDKYEQIGIGVRIFNSNVYSTQNFC